MIVSVLLLVAGTAFAGAPQKNADEPPEETLRGMLLKMRNPHDWDVRQEIFSGADDLRDSVTSSTGDKKLRAADRLPGMAKQPDSVCGDIFACTEAPRSLHVEAPEKIDEAILALARPWFNLQKYRGKAVEVAVDRGVGVQLKLEDFAARPVVTFTAEPASTGGFDVALVDGDAAAKDFAAQRASTLRSLGD
ncbi:MAG: hypothetical protein ACHQ2Z_00565 [Elusimicrobiota bacterium]